jgi:hypothetical protein
VILSGSAVHTKGMGLSLVSFRKRSPVRQTEKNFFLSVNYLTLVSRFLKDAA